MRRLFEFGLVAALIAVPATLLLQRLGELREQSAQVQLRMGAEAVRLNALLFQARCGSALEPACWRALLATRRDAAQGAAADAPARRPLPEGVQGLLRSVALAAGLADAPQWQLQTQGAQRLQFALKDVAHCRFVLAAELPGLALQIQTVEDRCCSRAPCA